MESSTCNSSKHAQQVKFSTYVAWRGRVGGVVAVVLVGSVGFRLEEEDDVRSVVELVVVVVVFSFLPSPSLLVVFFSVVLLDCIGTTEGLFLFYPRLLVFVIN